MSSELREFILYNILQWVSLTKLIQLYLYYGQEEGRASPIQTIIAKLIRKKSNYVNIPHRLPHGDLIEVFSKGDIQNINFVFTNEFIVSFERLPIKHITIKDSMEPVKINQTSVNHLILDDITSFYSFTEYMGKFINLKSLTIKYSEFDFENGKFINAKLEKLKIKQCWIFDSEKALVELIKSHARSLKELYVRNRYPDDIVNLLKDTAFPYVEKLTISFKAPIKLNEFGGLNSFPHVNYLCAIVQKASDGLELLYQILRNCKIEIIIIEITDEVDIDQVILKKIAHLKAKHIFNEYIYIRFAKYTYIAKI